jgi:RHS repeat-associated protein
MTDANGHTTRYQYDPAGNRLSMTDALGNVTTWTYDPVFNEPTSMTDPNGRITQWQYDPHGNQIKEIDPLGQTETWTYDSHGNVLSATDKRGYTTTNQYDPNGNLILESDAVGTPVQRTMEYTYDADGNRISMTDALGRVILYQYDGLNRLTQETDAVGTPIQRTTETTYDGDGDRISMTDALGRVTQYQFDARNRMTQETDAVGTPVQRTTETMYDGDDNRVSTTDALGRVTQYQYDGLNRRIQETDAVGTPQQRSSTTTYDGVGNVITTTDANGHTTTNGYDALNRRISMTDPLGNTTVYEYANLGGMSCCGATGGSDLLTGMIDANGKATYYHYDELNRPIQTVRKSGSTNDTVTPADAVTTTTYDPDNNRIAVTDANGNTTAYTYDALDRQTGRTNAAGDVSTTAYDPVGNVLQTTDPRGDVTTTVYDALNRPIQVTDSLGPVSTTAYDPVGNVISTTDANGNTTSTTYDALNRHTSMTDPLGHPTTTTYDSVGNVLSTTDRNGNTTTWMYDPLDRQTSMTDALGDVSTTTYDPVGNRISTTDPLGHTMQYFYDADNRLIRETYPDTPADTRTYTYDGAGNRISMLDQNGRTTSYQYNDFYYLTNRQYSVGPNDQFTYDLGGRTTNAVRNGWTNDFTYDGADRVLASIQNGRTVTYSYVIPSGFRIITYPSGTNVTEAYDLRSRLIQVNDGGSPALTQYTYDADNNVLSRTNRNGTAARQTYNANNWVTSLAQTNAGSLITGHAYVYDYEGNRLSQMNQVVSSNSETYGYDALNRLTNFDVGVLSGGIIPSPATAESYTLDPVGNWSTLVSNSVSQTRTHSAANELLTLNGSPLMYDANGNLTNDGRYAYTYDVQNRVTTVTRDSDTALVGQYFYDALGRRTTTVASPDGVATTNVLFYDGSRIIEEQNAGGTTLATYTYGNYVDEVLTMARGGETYYYHPDARFDVEAVTGSGGAVVERYTYDAYGGPVILDGADNPLPLNSWGTPHSAITNEFLFTGRELDEESGLYYFRARHYDAGQGRFLQRDPLGADAGVNQYAYVVDNPENHADAFGLAPDDSLPANWILGKAMNGKEYLWEWVSREPRSSSETVLLRDTDLSGPNGAWCRYVTLNYSYNIVKFRVYQPPTEKEWEQPPETIMRRARKVADITLWDSLSFSVGPKGAPFRCGPSCGAARGTLSAAGGVYLTHAWPGAGAYATPNVPAGLVPSWWTSDPVRQPPGPPMSAFSEAAPTGTEGTGGYMPQMFGD